MNLKNINLRMVGFGITMMLALALWIAIGVVGYRWYTNAQSSSVLIENLKTEVAAMRQQFGGSRVTSQEQAVEDRCGCTNPWNWVHGIVRNMVVQVFVFYNEFNWLEPYKTPQQALSAGSGFFITDSGLIVTNAHVVDQACAVYIQMPFFGKRRFDVTIVGICPDRDLALLQVIPDDLAIIKEGLGGKLPVLQFGDSDSVKRADEILTLGYPLGQESLKSTLGIVSGVQHIEGRSMIQVDAAINPGNSGGPSLDQQGHVIGINSAGIFEGGTQNVGYIIPSSEVKLFLKQLEITKPNSRGIKFLRKPMFGMLYNEATDTVADYLGNPRPGGPYTFCVVKGSPFEKAGLKGGDMLYEIDGYKVDYFGDIQPSWSEDKVSVIDYVSRLIPGCKIHAIIYRKGVRKELTINFEFSEQLPVRSRYPDHETIDYEVCGGLVVMELALNHLPILGKLNEQLGRFFELENRLAPVLIITHVLPDSEASKTRVLSDGLTIKEINGVKVTTLKEFRKQIMDHVKSGFITVKVENDLFTVLPLKKILADEPRFAANYFYKVTPFMQELAEKAGAAKPAPQS